jgi:hypothetical protein
MSAGSTDALGYIYQQLNIYLEITEKKAKSVEILLKKKLKVKHCGRKFTAIVFPPQGN